MKNNGKSFNDALLIRDFQLSRRLGISASTLNNWRNPESHLYQPDFPKPIRIGKRAVATPAALIWKWLKTQAVTPIDLDAGESDAERESVWIHPDSRAVLRGK